MNTGLIPVRYATALLSYANDLKLTDQVYAEAKSTVQSFFQFREMANVMENPVLPKSKKKEILLASAGKKVSKPFEKVVDLLLENNREDLAFSVFLRFVDLCRKQKNIYTGKLTTAGPVDAATEKRLIALVQAKTGGTLEIEKSIDPAILGGFLLEVDNVRWDASISGQLRNIRNEYFEKNSKIL